MFVSDKKSVFTFILLHSVLVPTSRVYKIDPQTKARRLVKTTINDSRNSFLYCVPTLNDLHNKIKEITDDHYKTKGTLQPLIFGIGNNYNELSDFYVYYYKILYKLPNFIKALDICFKSFHVFDLRYPKESEIVWTFIQYYFFDIKTKSDINSTILQSFLADIRQGKN